MYCTKCGAQNADGARFCVKCGNQMEGSKPGIKPSGIPKEPMPVKKIYKEDFAVSEPKPKRKIVVPIVLLVVLLAAGLVASKFILFGNSEKKVVKRFIDAEMTGDAEKLMEFIPDRVIEEMTKEMNTNRSGVIDMLDTEMSKAQETLNEVLGDDWSYSCKINSIEPVEGTEFDDVVEDYADIIDDLEISKVTKAEVEISVTGKNVDNSADLEIPLMKVDGKWYLDFGHIDLSDFGMDSLF